MHKTRKPDLSDDQEQAQIASEISHRTRRAATFLAIYLLFVAVAVSVLTLGEFTIEALLKTGQDHLALWALALTPLFVIVWGQHQSVSLSRKIIAHLRHNKHHAVKNTKAAVIPTGDAERVTNDLTSDRFELNHLLKSCVDQFMPLAEQKGVEVSMQIHQNVTQHLLGRQQQLRNVITSLLGNAIKHTEVGSVSLNVKTLEQSHGDVLLRFEVIDTGYGIDRKQQPQLLSSIDNGSEDGDLTLPEITNVVESLGGGIGVYSQINQGTTIWFTAILQKRRSDERYVAPGIESSAA